jgi:hypothetical protein
MASAGQSLGYSSLFVGLQVWVGGGERRRKGACRAVWLCHSLTGAGGGFERALLRSVLHSNPWPLTDMHIVKFCGASWYGHGVRLPHVQHAWIDVGVNVDVSLNFSVCMYFVIGLRGS